MSLKRVVISGIGTINPLGNNIEEFFSNLDKGVSGAGPIDIFDTTLFKTKFACQVKGYHPGNFGLDRKEYRKLDRYSQFALIATDEAIKDSSLDLESIDKSRVGVVLGTGIGGIETFGDELRDFSAGDGTPRFSPYYILKVIANIAAGWISLKYGFTGPGYATSSACVSSAHALMGSIAFSLTEYLFVPAVEGRMYTQPLGSLANVTSSPLKYSVTYVVSSQTASPATCFVLKYIWS